MISLTKRAVAKVKEISESEGIGHFNVRASVKGGGCAGMVNDLSFEEIISDSDEIVENDGVKLIIDQISLQYLENAEIDYIDSPFSGGFKFLSPDIKGSCGCGHSVSY
jgi:iron-sulfur cluster assembly accessory protein